MGPVGEVWALAGAGFSVAAFNFGAAIFLYLGRWGLARYCAWGAASVLLGVLFALS